MPNAKKLRYKLIAVVTVLMSATLVAVAAITHSQSLAVIREQSLTLNSRLVEAGVEKLGTSYSQLNNLFQSIYLNENFEAFLRTRGRREGHSTFQDAALMKTVFLSTLSSRSDLYSIIFVDWNGRLFYATRDEAGFYESYLACGLPETYLAQLEGVDGWEHGLRMLPTQLHIPLRSNRSQPPYVYTAARKIVNTEKRFEPVGVMFITVDLSDLERLTNLIRPDEQAITYIAGAGGRVIFDSSGKRTGGVLPERLAGRLGGETKQDVVLEDGRTYVMVSAKAADLDWYVMTLIPEAAYTADALSVSTSIVVTALLALLIAILITTVSSRAISRPVEELAAVMGRSGLQNLSQRVEVHGADEIAQLGESFNHLMDKLETSIHNEYVMNIRQKEATIRALQAQMNPHFLYNVLQSMGSIALLNHAPEINTMAMALGSILRYSVQGEDSLATVREEIKHVRNYLSIQKIRYGDRLHALIDVPEYVMDYLLPRVSLQPMVENAIIHGFEQRQEPGNISIRGWMEEDRLMFEVADDGQGIPPERLAEIKADLADCSGAGGGKEGGIGISNLNARLKLLYDKQGALELESDLGIGTVIRIEVTAVRR